MPFIANSRQITVSIGLALVGLALSGCASRDAATDPRLIGKWTLQDGNFKGTVAEFTNGGKVLVNLKHKWMPSEDRVGSYSTTGSTLKIVTGRGATANQVKIEVEYQDAELIVMIVQDGYAFGFDEFGGRWQRVGGPTATSTSSTGEGEKSHALTDARNRLRNFEQKRSRIEPLLETVLAERDELVAKLRDAGVKSTADLKGNLRGQKLAQTVQKITAEIAGLESQIATIDSALFDARAVIRRMEREAEGISEDEMRMLSEQLRQAEERTDGTPLPVTPLDVDAAVEKALEAVPKNATPKKLK
jgi:hypothetical protein